jgi:hypothetical protein
METVGVTGPRVSASDHGEPPRRRERKRHALVLAALTLFDAKGYEHTAARETTEAMLAAFDASARQFGPALAGHWT